ncbi:MAG: 2-oxoglutarate-dependent dioxygenase [Planctomycetaceae bacterium]|nr:2-oxoglutarate-dependent dioxygenase [Planctomycetaceae bacterium]
MSARNILEPGRREWVILNLGIGCTSETLISEMVRDGFESEFARAFVESFAKSSTTAVPIGQAEKTIAAAAPNLTSDWKNVFTTESVVGTESSALANVVRENRTSVNKTELNVESPQPPNAVTSLPESPRSPGEKGSAKPPYAVEPSRIIAGNVIHTSDREIRVLARMRRPDLLVLANVLSDDECDELIRLSVPKIERSKAIDHTTGKTRVMTDRTSDGTFFYRNETDFIAKIDRRISEISAWPVENGEGLQILRYELGGEYKPHFDFFGPHALGSQEPLADGGQRVATLIIYLNDVDEGGTTIFPHIGLSVSPQKGNALYFSYCNSLEQLDRLSYHGGSPVLKGEKWIATKWMRQRRPK